jgi:hypothetical protein
MDRIFLELMVLGGVVAGILWVVGLMLALQQLPAAKLPEEPEPGAILKVD